MNWLSGFGTVYNITGGILLARALMATPTWALRQQAGTFWHGNKALFQALILQRLDARFGLPLVLIGSSMQLVADFAAPISAPAAALIGLVLLLVLLIVVVAYWASRRHKARHSDALYDRTPIEPPN